MIRRPYRTQARFFSDSDELNTIHWYAVPWSNGTLPYPHRIIPNDWYPDRVNPRNLGEESLDERPFDGWFRIIPPQPGDHICGEPEMFSSGCSIDDPSPPLNRAADGIPDCCREPQQGVVLGGSAVVAQPSGAVVLGGGSSAVLGLDFCDFAPSVDARTVPVLCFLINDGLGADNWVKFIAPPFGAHYRVRVWVLDTNTSLRIQGFSCTVPTYQIDVAAGPLAFDETFTTSVGDNYIRLRNLVAPASLNQGWIFIEKL